MSSKSLVELTSFQAIRDVVAGRGYLSPLLSEAFTRRYLQKFRTTLLKLSPTLTTRERKVLRLFLEGASSCDIGARLKIIIRTVKSDLANFVGKLGLNTHHDIVCHAVKRRVGPRGRTKLIEKK
jgi:DNA-binding NarL/FixJ family response regulator